jgi:predicted transposase YbfD/YdcC
LEHGIPSHDTFRRVFSLLPAEVFESRFRQWVEHTFQVESGQVIAVDGKTVRGAGLQALHLVSAWAHRSGIVLGQRKVEEKSNEITAIPQLLDDLYLAGSIVTLDAMGTQTAIAQKILDKKADYVLALKGNQGQLHADVQEWFAWADQQQFHDMPHSMRKLSTKIMGGLRFASVGRCPTRVLLRSLAIMTVGQVCAQSSGSSANVAPWTTRRLPRKPSTSFRLCRRMLTCY